MSEPPGRRRLSVRRARTTRPPLLARLLPAPAFRVVQHVRSEARLRAVKAVRSGLVQPLLVVGEPAGDPLPTAALIPLVHPRHPSVTHYADVESHLERTLTSIGAQRPAPVRTVVVGQAVPPFAGRFGEALTFVDASASAELHPERAEQGGRHRYVDKGIKYLIGQAVAEQWFGPEVLLTVDADDLLVRELTSTVSACLDQLPEAGGVTWTRGLEVAVDGDGGFSRAIEVEQFHKLCGTSRAIRTSAFVSGASAQAIDHFGDVLAAVRRLVPAGWNGGTITLDAGTTRLLDDRLRAMSRPLIAGMTHWSDHIQDPFHTARIAFAGAAKVCGHGQHVSQQNGLDLHRLVAEVDVGHALSRVGL